MLKGCPLFCITFLILTLWTPCSFARLNKLTTGVTTGCEITKTLYRKEVDDENSQEDERSQQITIGPIFILESSSSIDTLTVSYKPGLTYDFEDEEHDINHDFTLSVSRNLNRDMVVTLQETFLYSDDPSLLEDNEIADYNEGRDRYWTNTSKIKSAYTYAKQSMVGGEYSYQLLRNDDSTSNENEDYDKQSFDFFINHHLSTHWNSNGAIQYTRGIFDISDNVKEYHANASVAWLYSPINTIQLSYGFSVSDYDSDLRNDSVLHNLSLGTHYQYSKFLGIDAGAGPSFYKTTGNDGDWNYNANLTLQYSLSKYSSFSTKLERGYVQSNFSTNNSAELKEQGLTEFQSCRLDFSHKPFQHIDLSLYVDYRDEQQESYITGTLVNQQDEETSKYTERINIDTEVYRGGGTIQWTFLRYWKSTLGYDYRKQDSQQLNDSYDEHRVYLRLSAQNELFRW